MIVATLILVFVAVCGFIGYAVGGATILEGHLQRRAAKAAPANVTPIGRARP